MLKVIGIEKSFKRKKVLAGASFEAEPGTCVGIVGGNGCGKTTLLSIVAGAARPDGGSVSFDGHEAVGHPRVYEKYAAYVPQENPCLLYTSLQTLGYTPEQIADFSENGVLI